MSLIPERPDITELHPSEISSQEWADLMGFDEDDFIQWYESEIDIHDAAYPVHDRAFAYSRIIGEWTAYARVLLDAVMHREPHPSHVRVYERAQSYLLKIKALTTLAQLEGFDLEAERYPSEAIDAATIADLLSEPDAIAVKLAECAAANDDPADVTEGAA